ncbi:MFS transporter [Mangrovicoccus ximenensis]|uniref:hypothetical protein n=1 Tax=Mangrovicoccus ximenensis TaxID=1911570 RepID=UPI002ED603DC
MLRTVAATILFAGSFFAIYTYVAPILQEIGGAGAGTVTLMLVLIGIGLTLGNWIGGKLADRSVWGGAAIGMGALALTSLAVPVAVTTPIGAGADAADGGAARARQPGGQCGALWPPCLDQPRGGQAVADDPGGG